MSKIERAMEIVKNNPNASRSELIDLITKTLEVSKGNAGVYLFNVSKKMGTESKPAKTVSKKAEAATLVAAESVKKKNVSEIKAKNLETMREVTAKRSPKASLMHTHLMEKGIDVPAIIEDTEEAVRDAEQFVREHAPKFLRKEMGLD